MNITRDSRLTSEVINIIIQGWELDFTKHYP